MTHKLAQDRAEMTTDIEAIHPILNGTGNHRPGSRGLKKNVTQFRMTNPLGHGRQFPQKFGRPMQG